MTPSGVSDPGRWRRAGAEALVAVVVVLIALVVPAGLAGSPLAAQEPAVPEAEPIDPPPTGPAADPDEQLRRGLDAAVALSPADACLVVEHEDGRLFAHNEHRPLIPASTHKLLTAAVAVDRLGADHRFTTRFVTPHAPVDGVIEGDVALVGGGDPLLTSSVYALVRQISPDEPLTSLDALADQVAAAGVTHIRGSVWGDESRYDSERTVASWPERFVTQNQVGPLSALTLDDGYILVPGSDGELRRERSQDPAGDAARTFAGLLRQRGIVIDGLVGSGPAPAGSEVLAEISSAPLDRLVDQLLRTSDNGTAELITKELGVVAGTGGTTAAGVEVLHRRGQELGLIAGESRVMDGSGLDPGNRRSCDELIAVLEGSGGREGTVAAGLAVAGESGTLRRRFTSSPARGRLVAKTGALNSVTTLAGFVDLSDGSSLTFAYMANGAPVTAELMAAQEWLGAVLAGYEPACTTDRALGVVAPQQGSLTLAPGLGVGAVAPVVALVVASNLSALEQMPETMVSRCLAEVPGFRVTLR